MSEVADLYVALRAETAPMLASFAQGGTSAEEMAAQVLGAAERIQAEFVQVGASSAEMAAAVAASQAELAASFEGGVAAATAEVQGIIAAQAELAGGTQATAAEVAASEAELAASYGVGATAAERSASQTTLAFAAMRDKIAADLAGVEAAEATAAASTEAMAATMAGSGAAMGTASVAAATFKASLSDTAGLIGLTSGQLLGAAAAAGVVAGVTVKMAADFESSTTRLVTSAGEARSNLDADRDGILKMAGAVGYSAEELSKALYTVNSGGQHGAEGLKVLQAAAEGAKTENASLVTVADAVTSVLQDYHLKADDAATVTSKLVAATGAGKTTFQELAGSMASVLPVASANHVSLNDILGDLASMTVHGMSAQQAAQNLTDVINHMAGPTMVQSKELAVFGINAQNLSADLGTKGLSGTLNEIAAAIQSKMGPGSTKVITDLTTALHSLPPAVQEVASKVLDGTSTMGEFSKAASHLDVIGSKQAKSFATLAGSFHQIGSETLSGGQIMQSYSGALQKATGDSTGLRTALMLTGENSGTTSKAIGAVSGAATEAGNHVKGWGEIQETFNQRASQAGASLGALGISIGEKLLPVVSTMMDVVSHVTQFLADNQVAATAVAIVVGVVLVAAFVALGIAAGTAAVGVIAATWPILLIIAAVALLAYGIYELVSNWSSVVSFFQGIWSGVESVFDSVVGWFGDRINDIGDFFSGLWDNITGIFGGIGAWFGQRVDDVVGFFTSLPAKAGSALASLGSTIGGAVSDAASSLVKPFVDGWNTVVAFFSQSPRRIGEEIGHAGAELVKAGANLIINLNNGILSAWHAVLTFFTVTVPNAVVTAFVAATTWLINTGVNIITGLNNGILTAWHAVLTFFTVTVPNAVVTAFVTATTWLINTGVNIITGLNNGILTAWHAVVAWFTALPGNITSFLVGAAAWLITTGRDVLNGFLSGVTTGYHAVLDFFTKLPTNVENFFVGAEKWLLTAGQNIINGLWNGAKDVWKDVTGWISDVTGGAIDGFNSGLGNKSPSVKTYQSGVNLMQGLQNGTESLRGGFLDMVGKIGPATTGLFSAAGNWLVDAGRNVVQGLWNGISQLGSWLYSQVSGWASGIVNAAKSALGIASPSVHMHEAGQFFGQGLANGIIASASVAVEAARSTAARVVEAGQFTAAQRALLAQNAAAIGGDGAITASGVRGVSTGSNGQVLPGTTAAPGSNVTVVNLAPIVQGHVWTTKDLVTELQQELVRHGIRNTGNATQYMGFGSGS